MARRLGARKVAWSGSFSFAHETARDDEMTARPTSPNPRYEPHERPPARVALGLGLQSALLEIAPMVLYPLIVVHGAGGSNSDAAWMIFVALAASGAATLLQTVRIGPIGSGYILTAIPAATSIPFCILALLEGGPSTLAALVIVSGLFQIVISMRLSLLRRIFTPTVTGTIMMLLVVTVVSVIFSMMDDVPPGAPSIAGPACAFITLAIMVGILLRGSAVWRLWAPVIAIVAGCCAAEAFGIYDLNALTQAPWVGFPIGEWSGPGLNFGLAFWALLPAFLLSSIISVIQTNAVSLSAQRVSWRSERAIDFRRVEGGALAPIHRRDDFGGVLEG